MSMKSDLLFYFNNDLFLSSNFFSTMMGSTYVSLKPYMGQSTYNEPITDKEFKRIRKYSRIATKFSKLSSLHRRMLSSIFDQQYQYPPEFRENISKYRNYDISGLLCFLSDGALPPNMDVDGEMLLHRLKGKLRKKANSPIFQNRIEKLYNELEAEWKSL